ncbi:nucleotidyltransferase family protein [Kribbella pittospori]|uniref:Nucleotidyltransferase family protein n=1 Tax=Kribbella pittospori TaxID=722689 RepID=A0A4V2MBJ0_9ACTN|nr:nucleotidyltransferase family protein [Kribbella pittospori]TCC63332.1 nucleotidyltransferase family protein [Kribbella pittospori]
MFVTGLVLAAGGSHRLGQPKQLLPYGDTTLLDAVLRAARECAFDQLLVTLGGAAEEVRETVDLSATTVVLNPSYGTGCSSSIVSALEVVDNRTVGIVLMLGDQPGVRVRSARSVIQSEAPIAVCRYRDGIGHPFWFARSVFPELANLHGDKGVWKLIESGRHAVVEVPVDTEVPADVDTWDDYESLLAQGIER